uniref:Zinc finger, CCHC-type n=1 Tax=Tanacetum cinerariifolium TaxID=118510 RepID=A0A6L2L5D8_TANCI|nr:hypothetical protein [Tanacetum cinerariifolium]
MAGNTAKEMTMNFGKLDKFEGHDFRRWQKKMHFLLTTLKVVYLLTTPMPELLEDATVEAIRIMAKWENDDYICRGHILNGMSDSLFDVYTNVESAKELWDSLESKYMAEDSSRNSLILGQYTQHGLKMDESIYVSSIMDKLPPSWKDFKHTLKHGKDDLSLVQLEEGGKKKHHKQNKGKKQSNENNSGSRSNKKPKLECWKCGKTGHFKRDCRSGKRTTQILVVDAIAWWIDSGATTHVCKDCYWFKTYEPVEDGYVLYMGDDHFASVHGKGSVYESNKYILSKSDYVYMSSSTVVNSSLWHARLGHVHYKRMLELSKDDLITTIDENPKKCTTYEALDKFRIYKTEVELQQNDLVKTLRTDRGGEYYDPVFFQSVGIIHETTTPYTPQQNGMAKRKNRALKEMVNSMLSYSGLSEGFWEEAMLTACYLLNRVTNKRNKTTPYELWYKKRPNLAFSQVWGCRAVVRLPAPKQKTLGEKGIDCICVGYAKHSKAYMFYIIEPNDSVSINSIIELRDAIFDENRFSSIPRPKDIIPNLDESQRDDHSNDVPNEILEPRKVDKTKKFLSSRFSMKDIREADVILGIKIKRENKGIVITQSHYIEKILNKFNREDCSSVSTPINLVEKLKPNTGKPVEQLEYSRAIGCLMYAMTSTRPDIAYAIGRLSRFTSNPSRQHWKVITKVFKYLRGTKDYGLSYVRYPSVLEAYSDASWINHVENSSSTSGWCSCLGEVLFHGLSRSKHASLVLPWNLSL